MDADQRAAFALRVKRYIQDKTATPDIARRTLIDLGIYTEDGRVSPEYGGTRKDVGVERTAR